MDQFQVFKSELEGRIGAALPPMALASLELGAWDRDGVTLLTDSKSAADAMSMRFEEDLRHVFERQFGPVSQISVRERSNGVQLPAVPSSVHAEPMAIIPSSDQWGARDNDTVTVAETGLGSDLSGALRPAKTLDRFCVNETNRLARHAAMRLLEGSAVPVTYLYGASGRGKTHLLNAVALEWLRRHPNGRLIYLHYDTLVADVSEACVTNRIKELKEHLQDTDILILDDVHLLRGRKRTQEELACLIERLTMAGKTVLIAGTMSPTTLGETGICLRLAERLRGGMAVELKRPDYELRLRIANQWAEQFLQARGFEVSQRQLDMVAWRCDTSIRELEGALYRLELEIEAAQGEINDSDVGRLLTDVAAQRAPEASVDAIFDFAADVFGHTRAELRSRARKQPIVRARQAFCLAARKLTNTPLAVIGGLVDRDHTTVMHSIKTAEIIAEQDQSFADKLTKILDHFDQV